MLQRVTEKTMADSLRARNEVMFAPAESRVVYSPHEIACRSAGRWHAYAYARASLAAGAQSRACMRQVPTAQINTSAPFSVAFLDMVRPDSGAARRVFLVTSARFVSFGAVTGTHLQLQSMKSMLHVSNGTRSHLGFCQQAEFGSRCADRPPCFPQNAPFVP